MADGKMKRTFVYLPNFDKIWKALNLSDDNIVKLENMILEQPDRGELIQGTGGLRKIRVSKDQKGKSGSCSIR